MKNYSGDFQQNYERPQGNYNSYNNFSFRQRTPQKENDFLDVKSLRKEATEQNFMKNYKSNLAKSLVDYYYSG